MKPEKQLNKIISDSISYYNKPPKIKWDIYNIDSGLYQYYAFVKVLNTNKFIFLLLTKRKTIGNNVNIYLEVYFTTEKDGRDYFYNVKVLKPLTDKYKMKEVRSFYITRYLDLVKLYGIVKYQNILNNMGKDRFVNDLYLWTKNNMLVWYKNKSGGFVCYDMKYQSNEIFIKVNKYNLFIYLLGKNYFWYEINNIRTSDGKLFNLLKNKVK